MNWKGIKILFEDNHILVANKPCGMLSQKDATDDDSILEYLTEYIKQKYKKPGNVFLGSVHRLDRTSSGVMVFAKTSKALSRLNESLRNNLFTKKYYAIVQSVINDDEGQLIHYLAKDNVKNIVTVRKIQFPGSKKAVLGFKKIKSIQNKTLVEIDLKTGRSHQIRAQLSFHFAPILADVKYGSTYKSKNRCLYLHCFSLSIPHPTLRELMKFECLPDQTDKMWQEFF